MKVCKNEIELNWRFPRRFSHCASENIARWSVSVSPLHSSTYIVLEINISRVQFMCVTAEQKQQQHLDYYYFMTMIWNSISTCVCSSAIQSRLRVYIVFSSCPALRGVSLYLVWLIENQAIWDASHGTYGGGWGGEEERNRSHQRPSIILIVVRGCMPCNDFNLRMNWISKKWRVREFGRRGRFVRSVAVNRWLVHSLFEQIWNLLTKQQCSLCMS